MDNILHQTLREKKKILEMYNFKINIKYSTHGGSIVCELTSPSCIGTIILWSNNTFEFMILNTLVEGEIFVKTMEIESSSELWDEIEKTYISGRAS
ncbi:MAG: hypothetical protein VXW65_02430 [Pseudomonadota bacterium]|nr:hypothetical protein [Pseudomonadota bacterium]